MPTSATFTLAVCNLARLYADLDAAFPGRVKAIGLQGDQVIIYLDALDGDEPDTLAALVAAHDPDALTPDQITEAAGRTDLSGLLADIATQRAALQTALGNWATLTQAEQIAVLRRDTAILERLLAVLAYLVRHWPL